MHTHPQTPNQRALGHTARLAAWTLAWVLSLALAKFGPEHLWDGNEVASGLAIAQNVAIGIGMIVAHARFLQGIDELQRKIQMEAMAITLGTGMVGGLAYSTVSNAGLIESGAEIGPLIVLMAVVYIAAIAVGTLRYR